MLVRVYLVCAFIGVRVLVLLGLGHGLGCVSSHTHSLDEHTPHKPRDQQPPTTTHSTYTHAAIEVRASVEVRLSLEVRVSCAVRVSLHVRVSKY